VNRVGAVDRIIENHLCRKECVRIADFEDLDFEYHDGGYYLDENEHSTLHLELRDEEKLRVL